MRESFETRGIVRCGLRLLLGLGMSAILGGCGGSGNNMAAPVPGASTNVVVLFTSTANDKLTQFEMTITGVSLRDNAGNTVTLFSDPSRGVLNGTEFMRLNGASEPLAMASVPQGTYTSATVKVSSCAFGMASIVAGVLTSSFDAEGLCGQGTGNTTVNLSSPLVISGTAMALSFDLQVSQSYTLPAGNVYTISPVFNATPMAISPNPTNDRNGKITGLNARIISVDASGNSFVAQTADGISSTLSSNNSTVFQGVAGLAGLSAGTVVNLDSAIQPNGALLATRVEVQNAAAATTDVFVPLAPASPTGTAVAKPLECFHGPGIVQPCYSAFQSFSSTVFHVSGQFSNLQQLPFVPDFSSSSFVLGQNVSVESTSANIGPGGVIATDITLEPQTVNGIITAVTNTAGFSVYTVTIAPYHIIPTTQQQPVLATFAAIAAPTTVTVYADGNTQFLQSGAVAPGSLLRFRGLVFDDSGALRMDCAKVLDGVTE